MTARLTFDPQLGLLAPDTSTIRDAVAAQWVNAFAEDGKVPLNTESRTPAGQLINAEAAEIEAMHSYIVYLSQQLNIKTAEGRFQDALGNLYLLKRLLNNYTLVTCQVTGLNGTVIPYYAQVRDEDGNILVCTSSITIDNSKAVNETTFRLVTPGAIAVPKNSVKTIITTVPGWDTVNNDSDGILGRMVESRVEFANRFQDSVSINAQGITSALYAALANLDGVIDVAVLENYTGSEKVEYGITLSPHSVAICIVGGEDAAIAETIYRKIGNGCDFNGDHVLTYAVPDITGNPVYEYRTIQAQGVPVHIYVLLGPRATLNDGVRESIQRAIYDDFYGNSEVTENPRVKLASTLYASRFYGPVNSVQEVTDVHSILIAFGDSPVYPDDYATVININGDQEPTLALGDITVGKATP